MNHEADNERLLTDVISEAAPADFREAMLGETLRLVRRRRRWCQTRRAAGSLMLLALLVTLVWQNWPQSPITRKQTAKIEDRSYTLIRTQPLPAGSIVMTRPLGNGELVASVATVGIVETIPSTGFRVINDDELLALVGPRPAALVRLGPNLARLIFVNPEDENGFPAN